jgi:histone H3/H4
MMKNLGRGAECIKDSAILKLQESAEAYKYCLFKDANTYDIHGRRDTIMSTDIQEHFRSMG